MFLSAVCCFFLPVFLEQCANQRINNKFRKINEPHLCKQELLVWLFVSAGVYTSFRVDQSGFKPWAQLWIIPSPSISFQAACRCGCARELNWNQSPLLKVKSLASVSLHQIWLRACVRRSCFFGGSCSVLRGQTSWPCRALFMGIQQQMKAKSWHSHSFVGYKDAPLLPTAFLHGTEKQQLVRHNKVQRRKTAKFVRS